MYSIGLPAPGRLQKWHKLICNSSDIVISTYVLYQMVAYNGIYLNRLLEGQQRQMYYSPYLACPFIEDFSPYKNNHAREFQNVHFKFPLQQPTRPKK
jgi:hypothetical protein